MPGPKGGLAVLTPIGDASRTLRLVAFWTSPAGQARVAYNRGKVFQYSTSVTSQKAIVVAMIGTAAPQQTSDPSVIANSVRNEGWELVSGSFVFVETGQQSRDKFMSSGQNVAISDGTIGYYLFKRSEANEEDVGEPWVQQAAAAAGDKGSTS
jgi:hypothetical protein